MDEVDTYSEDSVHKPGTSGEEVKSRHPLNPPLSPISCCESASLQSSEYMGGDASRPVAAGSFERNPFTLRRELARMIILHEYPLSMVDHFGFRKFSSYLNPSFGMISQSTVKKDILKIFEWEKNWAVAELNDSVRVAITMSMWTSSDRTKRFLAIAGHAIVNGWRKQSFIMRFAHLPCPCTNESIGNLVIETLSDYELSNNLSTITMDSYTCDDELLDFLLNKLSGEKLLLSGKLLRIPCFARTLGLMVQDGFDAIRQVIEKIRLSIVFWTASPQREQVFDKAARHLGMNNAKKLVLDYEPIWSSTYLMLQETLLYKDVFSLLKDEESQYTSAPHEEEWELVKEVYDRLKMFYNMMKLFSKNPTANVYFLHLCDIKLELSEWLECDILEVKKMATEMFEKFDKYWSAVRDIVALAIVFDPRFRLRNLKFYFQKFYGSEADIEIERIRQICYDLFYEYQSPVLEESMQLKNKKRKEPERTKLDVYLEEHIHIDSAEDFDILSWWRDEIEHIFPTLQKIARDLLAIPVCAVAPENAFNMGGSILGQNRSRLHPLMVEKLMCTQSWLRNYLASRADSSAINPHSWGTIHDDLHADHEIIDMDKPVELDW